MKSNRRNITSESVNEMKISDMLNQDFDAKDLYNWICKFCKKEAERRDEKWGREELKHWSFNISEDLSLESLLISSSLH